MKTPKLFVPEKSLDPKTKQLLDSPKLKQPDERCITAIERIVRKNDECYGFMLTDAEIFSILEKLPAGDVESLERIIITKPLRNEHYKLFGRYEKGFRISENYINGRIYLFKHLKTDGKFVIELGYKTVIYTPEEFKIKNYESLLHEVGHHVAIKDFDDKSEEFAKNYSHKMAKNIGLDRLFL